MLRSRQSNPLSELRTLHKAQDVPALRQLYRLHGVELAEAAGVQPSGFDSLAERPESEIIIRGAGKVLDLARHRAKQQKYNTAIAGARQAAEELQRSSRWTEHGVQLDLAVVLGSLLQAPSKYLLFRAPDDEVLVERCRLVRLRKLARRMDGLFVYLSSDALCFRWKGGRGGLTLRCTRAVEQDSDVFCIVLAPRHEPELRPQTSLLSRLLPGILRELSHNLSP